MNLDLWLFHLLNGFVGTLPPLDWMARLIVNDYFIPTILSLVVAGMWFAGSTEAERARYQRAVILIVLGMLFAQAFIKDLSFVYFRPRPFAIESVNLLFYRPSVSSFPSIPVAAAFTFAMGAYNANPRLGKILFILGTLYGLARVYAGVHYPSDILGGAAIGAGMVWIVARLRFTFEPFADWVIRIAQRISFA
jgi:undecaprenyl-diphosphatase